MYICTYTYIHTSIHYIYTHTYMHTCTSYYNYITWAYAISYCVSDTSRGRRSVSYRLYMLVCQQTVQLQLYVRRNNHTHV